MTTKTLTSSLIYSIIGLSLIDLWTFLWVIQVVGPQHEIGPIGTVYHHFGPIGAIIWKVSWTVLILACAELAPKYRTFILVITLLVTGIGAAFNIYAAYQIGLLGL